MRRFLLAAGAAISLAGCQSTPIEQLSYSQQKDLAKQLHARCAAQGYPQGHPEFNACMQQEVSREAGVRNDRHQRRQRAVVCNRFAYTVVCG